MDKGNSYHNTTGSQGKDLFEYEQKAQSQEELVLDHFQRYPDRAFSPTDIHRIVFMPNTPITSVRRALTNLTKAGKLERTDYQELGRYSRPQYLWRLRG